MSRARVLLANLSAQSSHARDRWLTRLLLIAQNAFERERWMAHKTIDVLLTAQSALERERDWLTRLLASCSQLRERLKERERLAHKTFASNLEHKRVIDSPGPCS